MVDEMIAYDVDRAKRHLLLERKGFQVNTVKE
jgi:hypothetical protein